jgi:hypothetical protein
MNKEQIHDALRVALAAGGPLAALILKYTGLSQTDFEMWVAVALLVVPPCAAWAWGIWQNRQAAKVEAVARMSSADQHAALNKVSDAAKVKIAESVPDVATVVVRDTATGTLAALAASDNQPNIVSESQNLSDALGGEPKPSNTGD